MKMLIVGINLDIDNWLTKFSYGMNISSDDNSNWL